jgi:hypothetical protein
MTASSRARRARELSGDGEAAAGHRPVVIFQSRPPPSRQRRQHSRPAMDHIGIDKGQKQKPRLARPMVTRRHSLVA